MSSSPPGARLVRIVLPVVAVLVLGYSFLVTTEPLLGLLVVLFAVGVSLTWRFVYAFERIADALGIIAADRTGED